MIRVQRQWLVSRMPLRFLVFISFFCILLLFLLGTLTLTHENVVMFLPHSIKNTTSFLSKHLREGVCSAARHAT